MLEAFNISNSKWRKDDGKDKFLFHGIEPFLADYTIVLQSKSYRRLAYKTQVICLPENSHASTRATHTNEVIALSIYISRKLKLNPNLSMAIASAHDLGHVPLGHEGERILSRLSGKKVRHNVLGVVLAQEIERKGNGLDMMYETLEGVLLHTGANESKLRAGTAEIADYKSVHDSAPAEYDLIHHADDIANTFSNLNDAIRYRSLDEKKVQHYLKELGENKIRRKEACISALIKESEEKGKVSFEESKEAIIFNELMKFMYSEVYHKMDFSMQRPILENAYTLLKELPETKEIDPVITLALLTDMELEKLGAIMRNTAKPEFYQIKNFGAFEILPYLIEKRENQGKEIDYTNPGLDWGKRK